MRRAFVLLCFSFLAFEFPEALSQIGNPVNGPTKISNRDLAPNRRPGALGVTKIRPWRVISKAAIEKRPKTLGATGDIIPLQA
jgi:hypothetical protein